MSDLGSGGEAVSSWRAGAEVSAVREVERLTHASTIRVSEQGARERGWLLIGTERRVEMHAARCVERYRGTVGERR